MTRTMIMNQKRKTPVIHIILSVGLTLSFALILGLVIFNFVVINQMDEGEKVLTMFQDQSHFSKMKQAGAYNIIRFFKEIKQIMITTQALWLILFVLIPVRLMLLLIGLYPPPTDSMFSFLRRIRMEMESVFEAGDGPSDGLLPDVGEEVKKSTTEHVISSNGKSEGKNLDMSTL